MHCAKVNDKLSIISGKEAEEYVEMTMSSQRVTRVNTPVTVGRKRSLSEPHASDSSVKKVKSDDSQRVTATARRALYTNGPKPKPRNNKVADIEVHIDNELSVKDILAKMSSDMHMQFTCLAERIDKLESGLEERISSKVAQLLDKRVNVELTRIKKDVNARLDTFRETLREELADDMETLNTKVSSLVSSEQRSPSSGISLNVVIRNLPESLNENLDEKINVLIKDSLSVKNISVACSDRKTSKRPTVPGVVIAKFKSTEDKSKIMAAKPQLKNSRQHSNVYINHDQSLQERKSASNLKAIVDAVNRGDKLSLRGSRVFSNGSRPTSNTSSNHS